MTDHNASPTSFGCKRSDLQVPSHVVHLGNTWNAIAVRRVIAGMGDEHTETEHFLLWLLEMYEDRRVRRLHSEFVQRGPWEDTPDG